MNISGPQQPESWLTWLVDALWDWENPTDISELHSLLMPNTLNYLAHALECRENLREGWKAKAIAVSELPGARLFELARNQKGQCDYLAVSDYSTRWMAFAGFQHLITAVNCDEAMALVSRYQHSDFENTLLASAHNDLLPGWMITLLFRTLTEGLSIATRYAVTGSGYWPFVEEARQVSDSCSVEQIHDSGLKRVVHYIQGEASRYLGLLVPEVGATPANVQSCGWYRVVPK